MSLSRRPVALHLHIASYTVFHDQGMFYDFSLQGNYDKTKRK